MPTARTRWIPLAIPLVLMVGFVAGCQRADSPTRQADASDSSSWFEDVTEQRGLQFVHDAGLVGDYFMPQQMGSGAALFDFNKDDRLDLYFLHNAGPHSASVNRLYQQMPDGSFRDVSQGSGLDFAGYNMGVAIGDVNNDGWSENHAFGPPSLNVKSFRSGRTSNRNSSMDSMIQPLPKAAYNSFLDTRLGPCSSGYSSEKQSRNNRPTELDASTPVSLPDCRDPGGYPIFRGTRGHEPERTEPCPFRNS